MAIRYNEPNGDPRALALHWLKGVPVYLYGPIEPNSTAG